MKHDDPTGGGQEADPKINALNFENHMKHDDPMGGGQEADPTIDDGEELGRDGDGDDAIWRRGGEVRGRHHGALGWWREFRAGD